MKTSVPPVLITFALVCSALVQNTQAVSPPPDGGYPGGNAAEGQNALFSLTSGGFNTAVGWFSLKSLTTASFNTAIGAGTLLANTADDNTAIGTGALLSNTTGAANTANGALAFSQNTIGGANTAIGIQALWFNNGGNDNTGVGAYALYVNQIGNGNIAVGISAGAQIMDGNNNIDIGNSGVSYDSNTIRIGDPLTQFTAYIAGIRGVTTQNADAIPVLIDSAGQLGTMSSSVRFKKEIKPMDKASEAILALKPVTFHYKSDSTGTPQFGLIAEEVAKVNQDLVVRDKNGDIYTVRYDQVNAMLLNEFLKEHRTVQELKKEVAALTAGLQKVSAQVEASKPAPQMVGNNQ